MEKVKAFFRDYSDELLYKVQWPSMAELQASTVTVLIASLLIAIVIAAMDGTFSTIMKFLYQLIKF